MTYPPPGGHDPQHYHVSSQPPQPYGDPYAPGHNTLPPQQYNPAQYPQQQPGTAPMGVQPGYPPGAPSALPPPIPPPKQGGNLGVILGVVVALVVVLGVGAVLLVPSLLEDDDADGASASTSESPSPEPSQAPPEDDDDEDTGGGEPGAGAFDGWGEPVNSEGYDAGSPEGAAIAWVVAADLGDVATLDSLLCSSPSPEMQGQYDYQSEYGGGEYEFLIWGMSRDEGGQTQAWANWTWTDDPPTESDVTTAYVAVEEDGQWKLCDYLYL